MQHSTAPPARRLTHADSTSALCAMTEATERDHLFISYVTEDAALAEWLTLKLTPAGYRVWCDRVKLLGGESCPRTSTLPSSSAPSGCSRSYHAHPRAKTTP